MLGESKGMSAVGTAGNWRPILIVIVVAFLLLSEGALTVSISRSNHCMQRDGEILCKI